MYFIVLLAILSLTNLSVSYPQTPVDENQLDQEWEAFKVKFGKIYISGLEERARREAFFLNKKKVEDHNNDENQWYKLEINEFADMSEQEFAVTYLSNLDATLLNTTIKTDAALELELTGAPDYYDLRRIGFVTHVKNQRDCGSCWAFATAGAIEGGLKRKHNRLVSLSEQNLLDCTENGSCRGSTMQAGFDQVIRAGGIAREDTYRYVARKQTCRYDRRHSAGSIRGYSWVKSESDLKNLIYNKTPVAVAIDASGLSGYRSGIYYNKNCSPSKLSHAVVAVGYGSENGRDYWILKNSWGSNWGENGFFRIARNQNNHCGIVSAALWPVM